MSDKKSKVDVEKLKTKKAEKLNKIVRKDEDTKVSK
jgi:hypothetical protein